jgi:hypothetical protein
MRSPFIHTARLQEAVNESALPDLRMALSAGRRAGGLKAFLKQQTSRTDERHEFCQIRAKAFVRLDLCHL